MDFEFNPFRLLIPPGGEPIRSIQITSNIDWLTVPGPITGQQALMPLNTVATIPALKVFATGSGVGAPTMRSLLQSHIPNIEISQVNGLQAAINSLVKSIASGSAALSVTNNGVGDYLITPNFGTTSTTFAIGNDSRFSASVTGIRLGVGAGSFDTAAITRQHYWDRTVFIRAGDPVGSQPGVASPDRRGLVPDPGAISGATRFLNEDGTWKTPSGAGTVTSVGLSMPGSTFIVAGSPVTSSGTLTTTFKTQAANLFMIGPVTGAPAVPFFRTIDYADVSVIVGNSFNTIAAGDDSRFPASVSGLRKSSGGASTDVAAIKFTDYWDNTVFGAKGPSSRIGLVPDPGPGAPPYTRFLKDDGTWQPLTLNAGSVDNSAMAAMPANTVKANATGSTASPADVSAKDARSSLLLNLESITTFGNVDYTALSTDRYVTTTATLTAARTVSLPLANTFNPSQTITVADDFGAINGAFVLKVQRQGADLIQGSSTAFNLDTPKSSVTLTSDGVSKWSVVRRAPSVVQRFYITNATYTTPTGLKSLLVECIGGGGGGAGAVASASNAAAGAGGAGAGYARTMINNPSTSYVMTIGTGGGGGTLGAAGGNGTATSFGSACIGDFGGGGAAMTGGTTVAFSGGGASNSGTGDFVVRGSDGGTGMRLSGTGGLSGAGMAPPVLGAIRQGASIEAGGNNAFGYGSGGAGALSLSATGKTGGSGSQGIIIVTEYY